MVRIVDPSYFGPVLDEYDQLPDGQTVPRLIVLNHIPNEVIPLLTVPIRDGDIHFDGINVDMLEPDDWVFCVDQRLHSELAVLIALRDGSCQLFEDKLFVKARVWEIEADSHVNV
jgi:hypothetical protein